LIPYHYPPVSYIKQDDPELPTYYFDQIINPISAYKTERHLKAFHTEVDYFDEEEMAAIQFPEDFRAVLDDHLLFDNRTTNGIALL